MRQKRLASHFAKAAIRLAQIKKIDPNLDMGNGLTVASYESELSTMQTKLDAYNTQLAGADVLLTEVEQQDKKIRDFSDRMLAGVGAIYGKNSTEYQLAGGTRKDQKKRPKRKIIT